MSKMENNVKDMLLIKNNWEFIYKQFWGTVYI